MKGVILCGGLGTRLRPMTLVTNKHLLPVYDRPMVHFPIRCLLNCGIDEILIVTGGEHAGDFLKLLRNGKELGIRRLQYAYQEGEGGIAHALQLAEDFADGGRICVVLGDNIVEKSIHMAASAFRSQPAGAKIVLKEVPDPHRFGVATLQGGKVVEIIEKPAAPRTNLAVTGHYFYDATVFDKCRAMKASPRGELEITDVNSAYLAEGALTHDILDGWWTDAGTIDSLYRATALVAEGGANKVDAIGIAA